MILRSVYLALAIGGAIIPYGFFISFGSEYGLDPGAFLAATVANGAVSGFTADLLISSFVFWLFMYSRVDQGPAPWPFVALNLCIGLSCALPAYLWACSRKSRDGGAS